MTADDHLWKLGPCGLDCSRCVWYGDGPIRSLSRQLRECLGDYARLASGQAESRPALRGYPQFQAVLELFAGADCPGCRAAADPHPFCAARTCSREKGVDFCGQCDEYPCDRNRYGQDLKGRWLAMNDRIRLVGPQRFHQEQKSRPRY